MSTLVVLVPLLVGLAPSVADEKTHAQLVAENTELRDRVAKLEDKYGQMAEQVARLAEGGGGHPLRRTSTCASWCSMFTCQKSTCHGCSFCSDVEEAKACAGYCNEYTCDQLYCKGCDVCSTGAHASPPPAPTHCSNVNWAGKYQPGDLDYARFENGTFKEGMWPGPLPPFEWTKAGTDYTYTHVDDNGVFKTMAQVQRWSPKTLNAVDVDDLGFATGYAIELDSDCNVLVFEYVFYELRAECGALGEDVHCPGHPFMGAVTNVRV